MTAAVKSGACSGCSTRRRRARVHNHRSRGAVERQSVAPAAPRPWTGSFRLHAERTILAKLACTLARARAVPLAAQAVRSRTQWQSYGEPSSGGWPTPRGSCATTEIGVRSDARPGSLSAVLENECANPTHDRVAEFRQSFRQIRPSRAIALGPASRAVASRTRGVGRSERASSALVRVPSVRRGAQASSGINYRREPPRSAVASQLAAPRNGVCSVCVIVIKPSGPLFGSRGRNSAGPPSVHQ